MNTVDTIIENIEKKKSEWNYKDALKIALEWLHKNLSDYRIYEELADIYIYQEDYEKAEEVIQYARELHPNSGTGLYLEGYIYAEKWHYQEAIQIFEKANQFFPNNAEVLRSLWWCHMMVGEMQKSIALLKRAIRLAPEDEKILQNLQTAQLLYRERENS